MSSRRVTFLGNPVAAVSWVFVAGVAAVSIMHGLRLPQCDPACSFSRLRGL
jgi:hypothetical protein